MFILFGYDKSNQHINPLIDTYCCKCRRETTWHLFCETEWISLFFIKTIPVKKNYYIACEGCNDIYDFDKKMTKRILNLKKLNKKKSMQLHDELVEKVKLHQKC